LIRWVNRKSDMQHSLNKLDKLDRLYPDNPFTVTQQYKGFGTFSSITAKQIPQEIAALYKTVAAQRPRVVCEIGTFRGGTLFLWTRAAASDALILSMDLPPGLKNSYTPARQEFYKKFARAQQTIHCVAGDSHAETTAAQVRRLLADQPIDFLFIDGDHGYDGARRDWDLYSPMVRENGLIAFHDIIPRSDVPGIEVWRLWNELKKTNTAEEFIDRSAAISVGIGLIRKKHS
jgi:predicted O-methyltransferase YrrM